MVSTSATEAASNYRYTLHPADECYWDTITDTPPSNTLQVQEGKKKKYEGDMVPCVMIESTQDLIHYLDLQPVWKVTSSFGTVLPHNGSFVDGAERDEQIRR